MRKRLPWFYFLFCLSAVVVLWGGYLFDADYSQSRADGPTEVGGSIDTNTTWTLGESPYIVTDTLTVEEDATLTIEAGVTVKFDTQAGLIVRGILKAEGSHELNITFTTSDDSIEPFVIRYDIDTWFGIQFISGQSAQSVLMYCKIEKCTGWPNIIIRITDSSPRITHCTFGGFFSGSESGGCYILCEGDSYPTIENTFIPPLIAGYNGKGIVCIPPSNPHIKNNNIGYDGFLENTAVRRGGFLDGNYLFNVSENDTTADISLGEPVDGIGDSICTTTSTNIQPAFVEVDGVTNPRTEPNDLQVNIEDSEEIENFKIFPNYPNPFNPSTTINFSIPEQDYVTLSVYDITGQKVATLVDRHMSAGKHSVVFDGSDLGSGVYIYKLQAGNFIKHNKMLLVR